MQYSKCQKCIHNGKKCKMIMAQAMSVLSQLEYLVAYSQPRYADARCDLKIDLSCENFVQKGE